MVTVCTTPTGCPDTSVFPHVRIFRLSATIRHWGCTWGRQSQTLRGCGSLESALADACSNLATATAGSSAQITHDPLPHLNAESSQITQLLQNLLGDGIKFSGDKPALLHVGAQRQGNESVFSVADQGIGIERQYFSRIFELFKRLHTRAEYPGTGVGLALCLKIIRRHGGRIWVESEVGQGATFFFTLPANCY